MTSLGIFVTFVLPLGGWRWVGLSSGSRDAPIGGKRSNDTRRNKGPITTAGETADHRSPVARPRAGAA
jgi:hypothetical protein